MVEEPLVRLKKLRDEIDELDKQIIGLLNDRAKIVIQVRKAKDEAGIPLYVPSREEEIFEKIAAANEGPLFDDSIREIYECILHYMKSGDLGE